MDVSNADKKLHDRRSFINTSLLLGIGGITTSIIGGCKEHESDEGQEVSPPEDLMQEHGLLNRVLVIYDTCRRHLVAKEQFPIEVLQNGAGIIRSFVEDYHEKQEENYLFPRFRKANQLTDLVDILLKQHKAGRAITDEIMQLTASQNLLDTEQMRLIQLLDSFQVMYLPHEAREDTVLFPAFRKLVSRHEYDSLGEEFEKNEQRLFGKDGFETMVNKVAQLETKLGIDNLNMFTPKL